jgi:SnoaL-like domain
MEHVTESDRKLLSLAYKLFNVRDIDGVLRLMSPDVDWPNGMEGGRVHGHDGVREYWKRQWALIDPHVAPIAFETDPEGHVVVEVHQVVRDLTGQLLLDQRVDHLYSIEDGLIHRMDISAEVGPILPA